MLRKEPFPEVVQLQTRLDPEVAYNSLPGRKKWKFLAVAPFEQIYAESLGSSMRCWPIIMQSFCDDDAVFLKHAHHLAAHASRGQKIERSSTQQVRT